MKLKNSFLGVAALSLALLSSCSTPKNIAYFQDISNGETIQPQTAYEIRVMPKDKLSIIVSTQDPALSMLFNLVQNQTRLSSSGTSVGNAATSGDGRTSLYTVDNFGDINFPVLGKLHIAGMRRADVAEYIEKRLMKENLVKQPIVTVEFINTGVSVLGEVYRPGRYEFNEDEMTLLDAIALAGDLKNTGQRENVTVLRNNKGQREAYVVNLTDTRDMMMSPAFYLQQDDVIYVEPNDKSKRETTSTGNTPFTLSFWVSVGSVLLSVATLVVSLTK